MKKDYVYQDKDGQFKFLHNATRIGGFYAGDGGIVPSERVLPEQRFAHQPIFRRPPEELVKVFSFISNDVPPLPGSDDVLVAELIGKSKTEDKATLTYGISKYDDKRYVMLKNWALLNGILKYRWFANPYDSVDGSGGHISSYSGYGWVAYPSWGVGESPIGGEFSLDVATNPIFFKGYVYFCFNGAVLFSKLSSLNSKKSIHTKEIKIALQTDEYIYHTCFIYQEGTQYKLVVFKETGSWGVSTKTKATRTFSTWSPMVCPSGQGGPFPPPPTPNPPNPIEVITEYPGMIGINYAINNPNSPAEKLETAPDPSLTETIVIECPSSFPPSSSNWYVSYRKISLRTGTMGGGERTDWIVPYEVLVQTGPQDPISGHSGWWRSIASGDFNVVGYKYDPGYTISFAEYASDSLEGPWVLEKEWPNIRTPLADYYQSLSGVEQIFGFNQYHVDFTTPAGTAIINELRDLVLSKNHKELSISLGYSVLSYVLADAYFSSPSDYLAIIESREEKIGEIVQSGTDLKHYLIKRLGNGQTERRLLDNKDGKNRVLYKLIA